MTRIFLALLLTVGFEFEVFSQITWDGGGTDNNWSTAANWSGNTVPTNTDDVIFDATSNKDCNFDVNVDILNLNITAAYTGTIDAISTLPVINGSFSQAGGVFFSSGDATLGMTIGGNMTLTGGTFLHNSGRVTFAVNVGTTTISGPIAFNLLDITSGGTSNSQRNVNFGNCSAASLLLNGASKIYGYQGSIDVSGNLSMTGTSSGNPANNTATITFSGAGPIILVGTSSAAQNKIPNIVMNTSGNYSYSGHISLTGNWTGTQGTLTVGSSAQHFYGASSVISGTAAAFDNLNIESGASVTAPANAEMKVGGNLTATGTLNFQSSSALGLNATGSTAQTISGTAMTLAGLKAYNSGSARNVTIGTAISILDSLKVGDNVTLSSGGNITLKASNALTARVAELGSGASVTGNVTVETFIPGGTTGWANLGVRGVSGQTIANWDTYVSSGGTNGLPMTCNGCVYSPTVIGTGSNSFVSVQGWVEAADSYTDLVLTDALTPGLGIWAYVGDGQNTTNDLKVINTGSLVQGNQSIGLTALSTGTNIGLNLVANPYACPVSWTKVLAASGGTANLTDAIYVWNADAAGGTGATTSYVSSSNSSSHSGTVGITDVIPGGQAFYVEYTGFIPSLDFVENAKTFSITGNTSSHPLLRGTSLNLQKFRLKLAGANDYDETAFVIHPDATLSYDKGFDAKKFFQSPGYAGYPGPYTKYTTISSKDMNNKDYSINTLPLLTQSLSVPILARVSASGSYTLSAKDFENYGMCVGLIDKLDNSYHDLRLSPYVFTISDTTSSPRFELILCKDESLNAAGISEKNNEISSILIGQNEKGAIVKTSFEKNTKANISVYTILGQKLSNDISVEGTVTSTQLPIDLHHQVVIIKVTTDKESLTKKIVLH